MKRIFSILILPLIFVLILFLPRYSFAVTWNDCPLGKVNDEYPGSCGRYIDTDKDNICDHSQLPPSERISYTGGEDSSTIPKQLEKTNSQSPDYHFGLLTISILGLYLLSVTLNKKNIINTVLHRKIWNILLFFAFITNAFTNIVLVIRLVFNIRISLPLNVNYWHIETGIVFTLIALFHLLWHLPYYKKILG